MLLQPVKWVLAAVLLVLVVTGFFSSASASAWPPGVCEGISQVVEAGASMRGRYTEEIAVDAFIDRAIKHNWADEAIEYTVFWIKTAYVADTVSATQLRNMAMLDCMVTRHGQAYRRE